MKSNNPCNHHACHWAADLLSREEIMSDTVQPTVADEVMEPRGEHTTAAFLNWHDSYLYPKYFFRFTICRCTLHEICSVYDHVLQQFLLETFYFWDQCPRSCLSSTETQRNLLYYSIH